jgi:hypothetical protein
LDPTSPANITGPINITTGNTIKDLQIGGTAGSAVNGTNSVGGTMSGVLIDGASARGVSLTNSTGTFSVTNSTFRNIPSHGIVASSDTGSFVWSVTGSTFANNSGQDVFSNTTGAAAQNVTVANSNSTGGTVQFVFLDAITSGSVGLNLTNNTVQGNGTKGRGLSVGTDSTTNLLALISGNNVTGCTNEGIRMSIGGNSLVKARFTNNRTVGNLLNSGLVIFNTGTEAPSFGAIFQDNIGDRFSLSGIVGTFQVEELPAFNAASNNTGVLTTTSVTGVAAGSLGIP